MVFPCPFCGDYFHKNELTKHVGNLSAKKKKKKNVAATAINIYKNDSDPVIILAWHDKHLSNNNEFPKNE